MFLVMQNGLLKNDVLEFVRRLLIKELEPKNDCKCREWWEWQFFALFCPESKTKLEERREV